MLTIFSVPKPFQGHIDVIQRNAIGSWCRLQPTCNLILCGQDLGTEEVAREHGALFLPNIRRNDLGTPLLDSIFAESCRAATTRLVCYSNADIILLDAFLKAVQQVQLENFLMIGQRTTVDLTEKIDFTDPHWQAKLLQKAAREGTPDGPTAIDYMIFPKDGPLWKLPPFAVGRPGWDNWFVERTRKLGIPVINATRMVRVLHQKHDYSHVPFSHGRRWHGAEGVKNRLLVGWPAKGRGNAYTVRDATHVLTPNGLRRSVNWRRIIPLKVWVRYPLRLVKRWVRKGKILLRMSKRPARLFAFCRYSFALRCRKLWGRLQGLFPKQATK
jgi:hypothetical protein